VSCVKKCRQFVCSTHDQKFTLIAKKVQHEQSMKSQTIQKLEGTSLEELEVPEEPLEGSKQPVCVIRRILTFFNGCALN
jgi:hypothetical protein